MELVAKKYKQTDVGIIPIDWDVKRLLDVSDFSNGKAHEQSIDEAGDFVVVNSKFISTEGEIFKNSNQAISPLAKGDITLVMSDIPNGKALAKCYLIEIDNKYTLNQRICSIKTRVCDNVFLFYVLNRNKYFLSFDSGSGQTNLRRNEVLDCPLAIPPTIAEQTAIATALSNIDELISQTEKLIDKKIAIKQGVMQELLKPKEGWVMKKLGDVCKIIKGQLITDSSRVHGDIPVIAGGKKPAYFHNLPNRFDKTITISGSGASAGYVSFHDYPIFASDCSTISESLNYDIEFIYYWLQLNQNKIFNMQTGGAQPHIHPSDLNPMEINLPSVKKQQEISLIITDIVSDIETYLTILQKLKLQKQGMMQALLTGKIRLI